MRFKFLVIIYLVLLPHWLLAEGLQENRINYSEVVTQIPATSLDFLDKTFSKDAIPWWIGMLGSTAVLYHNDEAILRDWQRQGREWGLGNRDNTKAFITLGEFDIIRLPTDLGSMMYFLGDGWMQFGIASGFYYYGIKYENNRAFNAALRLVHGMATSTIFNQFLKRTFGRESPYVKTEPFGRWSPYPSLREYQSKTSKYDAMPSGHIMTSTLVFTIINESYPEYSNYILPTSVVWLTLLGYQMVNNGVHWISDYPMGILMGYVIGQSSMKLGSQTKTTSQMKNWDIIPIFDDQYQGFVWNYRY